jgi:putative holliday junction resolvase
VLALDVGARRIGVALSDTLRLLANPLQVVRAEPRDAALTQIAELVRRNEVTALVVGMPLTLSGEVGPQAQLVEQFIERLRAVVQVPIYTADERLTSVEADRILAEAGIKPDQRKAKIDALAAAIILRDFLDTQRPRQRPTDYDD